MNPVHKVMKMSCWTRNASGVTKPGPISRAKMDRATGQSSDTPGSSMPDIRAWSSAVQAKLLANATSDAAPVRITVRTE